MDNDVLNPILVVLENLSLSDILHYDREAPVSLPSTCTLQECLDVLAERGFLSVIVYEETKGDKRILGTIDVLDIIAFYSLTFSRVQLPEPSPSSSPSPHVSAASTATSAAATSAAAADTMPEAPPSLTKPSLSLQPILEADWMEAEIGDIVSMSEDHHHHRHHHLRLSPLLISTFISNDRLLWQESIVIFG